MQRTYLAIDLKSYYASAECAARHLDPLTTNLVVADSSLTEKTICLSVSPSLKAYGIPGRARLFEVVQKVKEVNTNRLREAGKREEAAECDARTQEEVRQERRSERNQLSGWCNDEGKKSADRRPQG